MNCYIISNANQTHCGFVSEWTRKKEKFKRRMKPSDDCVNGGKWWKLLKEKESVCFYSCFNWIELNESNDKNSGKKSVVKLFSCNVECIQKRQAHYNIGYVAVVVVFVIVVEFHLIKQLVNSQIKETRTEFSFLLQSKISLYFWSCCTLFALSPHFCFCHSLARSSVRSHGSMFSMTKPK